MRQILWQYLGTFKKMYPTHPAPETWEVYERALSDVDDLNLTAACEICIRELKYFPMPAEIWERVKKPDNYVGTAQQYPDNPPPEDAKQEFNSAMNVLRSKLGVLGKNKSI